LEPEINERFGNRASHYCLESERALRDVVVGQSPPCQPGDIGIAVQNELERRFPREQRHFAVETNGPLVGSKTNVFELHGPTIEGDASFEL
jgi:hypothetical protein